MILEEAADGKPGVEPAPLKGWQRFMALPAVILFKHHWMALLLQVRQLSAGPAVGGRKHCARQAGGSAPGTSLLLHVQLSAAPSPTSPQGSCLQIMFDLWPALTLYTFTAWLPTWFKSHGVAPVTAQVGSCTLQ